MLQVGQRVTVVRYAGLWNVPAVVLQVFDDDRARVQFDDGSQWTIRPDIDLV